MGQVNGNGAVDAYMADYQYRTKEAQSAKTDKTSSQVKKHRVYGRTIGTPELSEKAQKCMMMPQQQRSVSSTADLSMQLQRQICLHRLILTAAL